LGLGGITVTKGIVAGLNRSIDIPGEGGVQRFEGLLQTDAAINPGNSGGALVNSAGQLIGVNSAAAQASTAENIGFAIAIDTALPIVEEIIEDPPEKRAWLGVSIATIGTPSDALQFGVDGDVRGAAIVEVFPDGPARESGVRPGEVITAVEGETVESQEDLTRVLTDFDPGETVTLSLAGPSGEREVDVELGERPVTID
jgi:S1-C subfamily serine protease